MGLSARKRNLKPAVYLELLAQALPTVIQTEEQNERMIELMEKLDFAEKRTPEQEALSDLLTLLVEDFEAKHYALKPTTPLSMLKHLMEEHGLKQKDLLDVFGTEGSASQVLSGKRELSKEHIRRLAKRFHVSPELFFS